MVDFVTFFSSITIKYINNLFVFTDLTSAISTTSTVPWVIGTEWAELFKQSTEFFKRVHSSPERLLCLESFISLEKSSLSTRIKNTSKVGRPLGSLHPYLSLKSGVLLKLLFGSFRRFYLLSPYARTLHENSTREVLVHLKYF